MITTRGNPIKGISAGAAAVVDTDFVIRSQVDYGLIRTAVTGAPPNAQNLGALATGVVTATVSAGVATMSTQAWTSGSVLFSSGGATIGQDNANAIWSTANTQLILGPRASIPASSFPGASLRLANAALSTTAYDIGRDSTTGDLKFYGLRSGDDGYVFTGAGGTKLRIDQSGTVAINNLSAGGLIKAAITTGILSIAIAGTDYAVSLIGTAPIAVANASGVWTVSHNTSGVTANTYAFPASVTVTSAGHISAITAGSTPVTSLVAGTNITVSGTTAVTVNAIPAGSTGDVQYNAGSNLLGADSSNFLWSTANTQLWLGPRTGALVAGFAGASLRLSNSALSTTNYDIGRNSSVGNLWFYGNRSGDDGFQFTGASGDKLIISSAGVITISQLTGGTAELVKISTIGVLSRATAGTDYIKALSAGSNITLSGTSTVTVAFSGRAASSYVGNAVAGVANATDITVPVNNRVVLSDGNQFISDAQVTWDRSTSRFGINNASAAKLHIGVTNDTAPTTISQWDDRHFAAGIGGGATQNALGISVENGTDTIHMHSLRPGTAYRKLQMNVGLMSVKIAGATAALDIDTSGNVTAQQQFTDVGLAAGGFVKAASGGQLQIQADPWSMTFGGYFQGGGTTFPILISNGSLGGATGLFDWSNGSSSFGYAAPSSSTRQKFSVRTFNGALVGTGTMAVSLMKNGSAAVTLGTFSKTVATVTTGTAAQTFAAGDTIGIQLSATGGTITSGDISVYVVLGFY